MADEFHMHCMLRSLTCPSHRFVASEVVDGQSSMLICALASSSLTVYGEFHGIARKFANETPLRGTISVIKKVSIA